MHYFLKYQVLLVFSNYEYRELLSQCPAKVFPERWTWCSQMWFHKEFSCFSDLNPLLIRVNITAFMSLIGLTDVQYPPQTQELFQVIKPTYILPYSNLYTPLKEAAWVCCLFPPPFSPTRVVSFTCLSHT